MEEEGQSNWEMENIFYGNAEKKLSEALLYFRSQIHIKVLITKLCQ